MLKTSEIEDLGLLKLTKTGKLFVGLLPSKYKALIVSYGVRGNEVYVSCVVPSTSHNVQVVYELNENYSGDDNYDYYGESKNKEIGTLKTLKHAAPTTFFTIEYPDIPNSVFEIDSGRIFIYDDKSKNKINLSAYQLPNVSQDGAICYGSLRPKDLRSAYNMFWSSPFNNSMYGDFDPDVKSNFEYIKRYKSLMIKKASFEDHTDEFCGGDFWSTQEQADGVLITSNNELLAKIPSNYWLRDIDNRPLLIVLADLEEDKWVFRSRKFRFEIDAKSISTSQSSNQKLIKATKKLKTKEKS